MILSPHEMAYLLKWAGIPDADLQIGVAIGCAESGGDTDAMGRSKTGANIGQRDHGWLQISGRWQYDKLTNIGDWRNPWNNAKMGAQIYRASVAAGKPGWDPWSTFHGTATVPASYLQWMPDAAFGVAHPFPPPRMTSSLDLQPVITAVSNLSQKVDSYGTDERVAFVDLKNMIDALHAQLTIESAVQYTGTITLTPKA